MPRIFISHSSRDNDAAGTIVDWLQDNGFHELFLDFHRDLGIPPGDDWEKRLYHEIDRATVVVLLLSESWLESIWCNIEFAQSRALGKAVLPVVILPGGEKFPRHDLQKVDILKDREGGLARLLARLRQLALEGPAAFTLLPGRAPYPGLMSFEREDAAVFHGRETAVQQTVGLLEQLRVYGGARICLLHGDSGSGKSSLLKAGLLPKLDLAGGDWIVTPPFRPRTRPRRELRAALLAALQDAGGDSTSSTAHAATVAALLDTPSPATAEALAEALRQHTGRHQATVLLAIDQFEELFSLPATEEQAHFLAILSALLDERCGILAVATLRSSDLPRMAGRLEEAGLPQKDLLLPPFPLRSVPQIVRLPAKAAGFGIDEALVEAIVRDATSTDMLPLVAFLLRDLHDRHITPATAGGTEQRLTLAHYELLADPTTGISPFESCIRQAADKALANSHPAPSETELAALRETFVTGLARLGEGNSYVRRTLPAAELPAAAARLCEALVTARLLILRHDASLEVAHESLFRVWPLLAAWLEEERDFHRDLARIDAALTDWQAQPEDKRGEALLTGLLLRRAEDRLKQHPGRFTDEHSQFTEDSARARDERVATVKAMTTEAQQNAYRMAIAAAAGNLQRGQFMDAARVLDATARESRHWEWRYLRAQCDNSIHVYGAEEAATGDSRVIASCWHAGGTRLTTLATGPAATILTTWNPDTGETLTSLPIPEDSGNPVIAADYSPDNGHLVIVADDPHFAPVMKVWDVAAARLLHEISISSHPLGVRLSPNGKWIFLVTEQTVEMWDTDSGKMLGTMKGSIVAQMHDDHMRDSRFLLIAGGGYHSILDTAGDSGPQPSRFLEQEASACRFSADGSKLAISYVRLEEPFSPGEENGHETFIYSLPEGGFWHLPDFHIGPAPVLDFSPDLSRIATLDREFINLWEMRTGGRLHSWPTPAGRATSWNLRFSPDGRALLLSDHGYDIQVLDAATLKPVARLTAATGAISPDISFSPDGSRVMAGTGYDGQVAVWDLPLALNSRAGKLPVDPWLPDQGERSIADLDQPALRNTGTSEISGKTTVIGCRFPRLPSHPSMAASSCTAMDKRSDTYGVTSVRRSGRRRYLNGR